MNPGAWWACRSPRELGIEPLAAGGAAGGDRLARFRIGAESPLFAGHFPARPLLPGVAQLALVTWALSAGAERVCREIEALRLRALVHPGDTLEVRITGPDEAAMTEPEGMLRFSIRRGEEVVTRGSGQWLPAPAREEAAGASAFRPLAAPGAPDSSPAPALPRLPHGAPALMLRRILAAGCGRICCECEVGSDHPLARAGFVPGYLALEAAAQAAGALATAIASTDPGEPRGAAGEGAAPRIGYLVGAKQARFPSTLPAGRPFRASAWLEGSAPPLAVYRFSVESEGGEGAGGTLSTYLGA
jgi:3-hydroxyacyl-[acyl-carrier-protein] dehydratase